MGIKKSIIGFIEKALSFIDFPLNDPGASLISRQQIPDLPSPCPPLSVQGFTGKSGTVNSQEWQAAIVYTTIVNSLSYIQKQIDSPVTRWGRSAKLLAVPRAGVQFNAYYNGNSLRFFYNKLPNGKMVYTCESSDVVTHELGHAILDALRPDLWSTQSIEIFAFHESFGDMNAILSALSYNEIIDFILSETKGDLRQSNIVSRLAEQMGSALISQTNGLRNAVNNFKYISPDRLTNNAPDSQLSREPHNFSRIFTGAFYDAIINQYEINLEGRSQKDALILSRDQLATILYNGVIHAANRTNFFDSVANAMITTDEQKGSKCKKSLIKSFTNRNIVQATPKLLFNLTGPEIKTRTIKLIEEMSMFRAENPLYSIDVDIPNHTSYNMNYGFVQNESIESIKTALDFIHETDKVSYDNTEMKEFAVTDGKLIRNFICCRKH